MAEPSDERGSLVGDLGALLASGAGADIHLLAGGSRLPAHRALLAARSPVFAAMLRHDTQEARDGVINMPDEEEEVVRQLLQFLYTDREPLVDSTAVELLVLADLYDIPLLKEMCDEKLASGVCLGNAAAMAVLAMKHSCGSLKRTSIAFIKSNSIQVMATDSWAEAILMHPKDTVQICQLVGGLEPENDQPSATDERLGSLAGDLGALLTSGAGADVQLLAGGARLPAHRALLTARSPVFAALLHDAEGDCMEVDMEEDVLREVLAFMYTGQVLKLDEMPDKLLAAADKYELLLLKTECEPKLAEKLSIENAAATAVLAVVHTCESLKSASIGFIQSHLHYVIGTDGWTHMIQHNVEAARQICSLAATPTPKNRSLSEEAEMEERLRAAARSGSVSELRALLAAGARVDARDGGGMTALHLAAGTGREEEARCLLEAGADVGARDRRRVTPLHFVASGGHAGVVQLLVAAGADLEARDVQGRTPLHRAAEQGSVEAARALLQAGASRRATDDWGRTPLVLAVNHELRALLQ